MIEHIRQTVIYRIKTKDIRSVSLTYNYWQNYYHPMETFSNFALNYPLNIPIFVVQFDNAATPIYLKKIGLVYYSARDLEKVLEKFNVVYILTSEPVVVEGWMWYSFPDFEFIRLMPYSFHNFYVLKRRKP